MTRHDHRKEADEYLKRILELQRNMGYPTTVQPAAYEQALKEAERVSRRLEAAAASMAQARRADKQG